MTNDEIKDFLRQNGEEKYKKFHISLTPGLNEERAVGVRVPVLRKYAKELAKKGVTPEQTDTYYYEELMLRGMLIGFTKYPDADMMINAVKDYIPHITNWALCDVFCGGLKQTKKFLPEMLEFIKPLITSKQEYEVRFAAVMLLSYYIVDGYTDTTLELLNSIKHEGYYAKMAAAWAYSVALVKYYEKTREFIVNNVTDKFTRNKAIQKACESYRITDEQKSELRKFKI